MGGTTTIKNSISIISYYIYIFLSFNDRTTSQLIVTDTFAQTTYYYKMTYSLKTAPFVAVPGPVAAAGLPGVLALAGFGLWRRRRAAA
jgi:MYXO-CTERM domain-containing protein